MLSQWNNNWYLDMDFNSKVCVLCIVVLEVWRAAFFLEAEPSIVNPVNKFYSLSKRILFSKDA